MSEGVGHIRPRARLLRTIGAELISNEVVAIIELVRNCYDADAQTVELHFDQRADGSWAGLSIRDDGHGMSREILLGPWLEPATDFKSGADDQALGGTRSPAGRRRLGSKGVGRFAAQRLGRHLDVRTRTPGQPGELVATFDWSALEQDRYLDEVRVPWREEPRPRIPAHGTYLEISQLTDDWGAERFERLKLGLSRLVGASMREAFRIDLVINGAREHVRPAIDANEAMYTMQGEVSAQGTCRIRYQDLNGNTEEWERTVIWPSQPGHACGPFRFRINAWDLDREPLMLFLKKIGSTLGLRDFRRVVRDHSGVSLYRDGFRILPYGEPDNDWLRLDRRRVNNPTLRLSNNQVLGVIDLTADDNPGLRDQTNREGLVTNEAYRHLVEVVTELLGYLEGRRFSARRSMDVDWQKKSSVLPDTLSGDHASRVEELIASLGADGVADKTQNAALSEAFAAYQARSTDALREYAGLATAGQLSALVFRQLSHPLRQLESELHNMAADIEGGVRTPEDVEDYVESVRMALKHLGTIRRRMTRLDPLALGGRGRRLGRHQANELVMAVANPFQPEFHRKGVTLQVEPAAPDLHLHTNREIAQQVLALLLENACHFASVGDAGSPVVRVSMAARGFTVEDNGPGVPEELRDQIWEPHFSTREETAGMGLTLAKDLLKTIGARVRLEPGMPTRFTVEMPERP